MLSRSRRGIQSQKYVKKRRQKSLIAAIVGIVAIGSLISAGVFFLRASFINIDSVVVTGTNLVSASDISGLANNEMSGYWLGVIPKSNIIFYPKNTIAHDISSRFLPIDTISLSRTGLRSVGISVIERKPVGLACSPTATSDATTSLSQCSYIDATGFVYALAPRFSTGVFVRYIVASTTPVLGVRLIDPSMMDTFKEVTSFFSGINLSVDAISLDSVLPTGNTYRVFVKNISRVSAPASAHTSAPALTSASSSSPSDFMVYFNTASPLEKNLQYFLAFWNHEVSGPSSGSAFRSIDMRYGKDIVFVTQ